MREHFHYEGTATGEYKSGLYVTYCGREYPADYLGLGRFILYSDVADDNFSFPTQNGKYLLQTDLRDSNLSRASEIRMIGILKDNFENVMIREILEEGIVISTYNPRLAFELNLKPVKELGFTGLIERELLIGMYEERDYLWNPSLGIYATFCQALNADCETTWFVEKDRMTQVFIVENPKKEIE